MPKAPNFDQACFQMAKTLILWGPSSRSTSCLEERCFQECCLLNTCCGEERHLAENWIDSVGVVFEHVAAAEGTPCHGEAAKKKGLQTVGTKRYWLVWILVQYSHYDLLVPGPLCELRCHRKHPPALNEPQCVFWEVLFEFVNSLFLWRSLFFSWDHSHKSE